MRLLVSSALVGAALVLSSCSSLSNPLSGLDSRPNQGPCPAAGSVYEAQRIVEFVGEGEQYNNITFSGEINGVRLYCRYVDDAPIEAQLEIDFAFGRGDAATTNSHSFDFFVAVTRTNRAVIEKQVFPISFEFRDGQRITTAEETIGRVIIPRADSSISGANFEILVGFELTDEQLEFNEQGRRFLLQTQ